MSEVQSRRYDYRRRGPSLFFPVMLMTIGIIWLLVNYGRVPAENVYRLLAFWPVLLVAAGLSLILRQISWVLSGVLWLAVGGLTIWSVMSPPANLPGYTAPEYTHKQFSEPLGTTRSASVNLDLSFNPAFIKTVHQDSDLFTADVEYLGSMDYHASGSGDQKAIRLGEGMNGLLFNLPAFAYESQAHPWYIGLSPRIPLKLDINGGIGEANIDLSELQLASLRIDGGVGTFQVKLPEDSAPYKFRLTASTGEISIDAPSGATFDMEASGGTGRLLISLPADSGVQVTVRNGGIGSLNLPNGYRKVRQGDKEDEGVWENEVYRTDETPITIVLDISIGSVTIR
jgi:hypothetical protein